MGVVVAGTIVKIAGVVDFGIVVVVCCSVEASVGLISKMTQYTSRVDWHIGTWYFLILSISSKCGNFTPGEVCICNNDHIEFELQLAKVKSW